MPYPNTALSAWQLTVMAVVAVTALAVWLAAVYLAAREPRPDRAAEASSGASPRADVTRPASAEHEPSRQAADRTAA